MSPVTTPGAMAPHVTSTSTGAALSWIEPTDGGSFRFLVSEMTDAGFTAPATIVESTSLLANWADGPSVVRAPSGRWLAHHGERLESGGEAVRVVLSTSDDGKKWTRLGIAHDDKTPTEHGFVSLLADGKDFLAVWLDGRKTMQRGGAMTLRAASVKGERISPSVVLDPRVCDCCGTSAAMTADGPIVVYRDRSTQEIRDIWAVRRAAGKWLKPQRVHRDDWKIAGCPVNGPRVAAQGKNVAVAWYTYANNQPLIRVAFSTDSGATFGAAVDVDSDDGKSTPLGRVGLVMQSEETALVSWMAAHRNDARIQVRRIQRDGRMGESTTLAETKSDRQAGFPRIAQLNDTLWTAWTTRLPEQHIAVSPVPISQIPATKETTSTTQGAPASSPPKTAPDTPVQTLDGAKVSLRDLKGKVVLINFWATYCEPCRAELPELSTLQLKYGKDGLVVIGVSVDSELDQTSIQSSAKRRGAIFTLWHDPQETLAQAFGVSQLPTTYLIDGQGQIVWHQIGAVTSSNQPLIQSLKRALTQSRDSTAN